MGFCICPVIPRPLIRQSRTTAWTSGMTEPFSDEGRSSVTSRIRSQSGERPADYKQNVLPLGRCFPPGTPVSSTRKLISSSSFHRLDMTLAVAEGLNPNKPNHHRSVSFYNLYITQVIHRTAYFTLVTIFFGCGDDDRNMYWGLFVYTQ